MVTSALIALVLGAAMHADWSNAQVVRIVTVDYRFEPSDLTAAVVQATEADNGILKTGLLLVALAVVMLLTLLAFLVAGTIERWLGATGMNVVGRILGILLAAVSAEMILAGLKQSAIFTPG